MITMQGKGVSAGVGIGPLYYYRRATTEIKRYTVEDTDAEWHRFKGAQTGAIEQLGQLAEQARAEAGDEAAMLFETHQMMAEDLDYEEAIENLITNEKLNAEAAVSDIAEQFAEMFASMDDAYMQARAADVKDVSQRILSILCGVVQGGIASEVPVLLAADDRKSSFATYYYNLLNLKQGRLPDGLMDYYQPAAYGLFLPVAPSSDYLSIYAANEVWFALGDMTMAEHAAILGMIFSPRCTGARAVKRLAEINLVNGDDAAAMKYLRLLQHTLCYRRWAEARMPGRQTEAVKQWLEEKRRLLPVADTLRAGMAVPFSLRHLIEACPDNSMAVHSLLCFDLLNKDIDAFITDYQRYGAALPQARLYSEAILIYLAGTQRLAEQADWKIPAQVLAEFKDYTRMYEANGGNGTALQARYRHTYWFYFHYATMKN